MTRYWLCAAVAVVLVGSVSVAEAETVVGIVSAVSEGALEVKPRRKPPRVVALEPRTAYARWITHQPWQRDSVAGRRLLTPGRCVAVELGPDGGRAKLVRISLDLIGTVYSPCR